MRAKKLSRKFAELAPGLSEAALPGGSPAEREAFALGLAERPWNACVLMMAHDELEKYGKESPYPQLMFEAIVAAVLEDLKLNLGEPPSAWMRDPEARRLFKPMDLSPAERAARSFLFGIHGFLSGADLPDNVTLSVLSLAISTALEFPDLADHVFDD